MRAGGVDLGVVEILREPVPESFDQSVLSKGARDARAYYKAMFRDVDAAIMLPGATPAHPAYAAMQDWLKDDLTEHRGRRTIHFHWVENGSAYEIPGQPLPLRSAIDALYQRVLLQTNYTGRSPTRQRGVCRRAPKRRRPPDIAERNGPASSESAIDRSTFRTATHRKPAPPAGSCSSTRRSNCPPASSASRRSRRASEGTVAFPTSQWDGRIVEGLKLKFARGRVTEVTATVGKEAVEAEMSRAGQAGRAFREFALGLNPLLAVPDRNPWIPYYGYGSGVVRLSLGDNSELGGQVGGGYVRWNFFTDVKVVIGSRDWTKGS